MASYDKIPAQQQLFKNDEARDRIIVVVDDTNRNKQRIWQIGIYGMLGPMGVIVTAAFAITAVLGAVTAALSLGIIFGLIGAACVFLGLMFAYTILTSHRTGIPGFKT